ncbi:conjugal transfer protein (plasmid) [Kribbella sp. WER1]
MKAFRKLLALPPTGWSWKAYEAEQQAGDAAADEAPAGEAAVEVYLHGEHPRMEIAGTTYVLEGADVDARRANAIQQVTERARNLGQPVRVNAHEPIGSGAVTFHPDGTVEEHPEPFESRRVSEADTGTRSRPSGLRQERPVFTVVDEKPTSIVARALRYLLLALVVLLCIIGVRSIIWPYGLDGPQVVQGATTTFPTGEATQVAARFTTSYLTWDERARDARAKATALDLAAGLDASSGWNGQGVQTVAAVYPGQVEVTSSQQAHVIVLARITPFKGSGQKWTASGSVWRRLSVPVEVGAARVVVSGAPAFVAEASAAGATSKTATAEPDPDLTASTESDARAFFGAYGTSDEATAAIAAPSSGIQSLGGQVELEELKTWTVETGNSDRRTALATVTWKLPGTGTQLNQDYRLTLLRSTAADGTQRWQVAEIANN